MNSGNGLAKLACAIGIISKKRPRGSARGFGDRRSTENKSGTTGRMIERVTRVELHGNGRISVSNGNGRARKQERRTKNFKNLKMKRNEKEWKADQRAAQAGRM